MSVHVDIQTKSASGWKLLFLNAILVPKKHLNSLKCLLYRQKLLFSLSIHLLLLIHQIIVMISCILYRYGTLLWTMLNDPGLSFNCKSTYCLRRVYTLKKDHNKSQLILIWKCINLSLIYFAIILIVLTFSSLSAVCLQIVWRHFHGKVWSGKLLRSSYSLHYKNS